MTNKLQLVLINVLSRSIFNIKVIQGSVSTRLSCVGIFSDQFIHYTITAESEAEKVLKIGQHL